MALLVAGCGSAAPARPGVALLPAPEATSHAWRWTPECPFGPASSEGCEGAGPVLGFAQLNGDEWNLGGPADAGSLDMSVGSSGAVTIEGRFASTPPCTESACLAPSAYTWVRGYPNVLYGINQCNAGTSPPESPRLPLPVRLDSIPPDLIGVTAYSAQLSQVTYDVAYDLWLHQTGTKQPCRSEGTLEIMVWTDYDARALLPASMQVGTADIPYTVDRVARPGTQAWSIFASNIGRDGQTAPWGGTLWFVPGPADAVGHGRVNVDLSAVLAVADHLLQDNYSWPGLGRRYWLDTASFGVEYGPALGNPLDSGPSRFSAQISAYCLDVRTTLLDAACG
jgi:Glycosyl hydrolase family 12